MIYFKIMESIQYSETTKDEIDAMLLEPLPDSVRRVTAKQERQIADDEMAMFRKAQGQM